MHRNFAIVACVFLAAFHATRDTCGQTGVTIRDEADLPPAVVAPADQAVRLANPMALEEVVAEPITGQPQLTMEGLVATAMANNPTIAQAQFRIQSLRGKHLQVGLYPNPELAYLGEEIGDEGRGGLQGMGITQEIVTAKKLRLNRAVVGHEITRAQHELEIQQQRVYNDVFAAAYVVLAAQRTMDLTERLVRIGDQGKAVAEELLKGKEVSRVDVLQARIEANAARLRRDNARNDHREAWRRLSMVVGVPDMEPARLADSLDSQFPQLEWESTLSLLLSCSPELMRSYAEVERAKCALARECAGRTPNVEVATAVLHNSVSEDAVASVGVAVPLQLFDRNQGNIHRAQAELAAAHQDVQRVTLLLQDRLASAFRRYANARQQVDRHKREILPDAKDSLELVQEGYRQGEFGYLELLTAQRTYFHTNLAYVQALAGVWVSATRIEGMLLEGGLNRPDE